MKTTKGKPPRTASGAVDWAEVNKALDFMTQNGLEEFEFAHDSLRIHLKKPGQAPLASVAAPSSQSGGHGFNASGAVPAPPTASTERPAENLHIVKSPIVGTYYGAANPQLPPYVKVGDRVTAGQVLCIIEAMKLMNEIESDVSGEVVESFAVNAQPVEYGEGLFAIRVDGK